MAGDHLLQRTVGYMECERKWVHAGWKAAE
jgi:hypothetical protein